MCLKLRFCVKMPNRRSFAVGSCLRIPTMSTRSSHFYLRGLAIWLLLILAESIHGTLREVLLKPRIGDIPARQISFFTALALIFAITYFCIRWIGAETSKQLIIIGMIWAVLTFGFEGLIGIFVFDISIERFLDDYNIFRGGLMFIGLIALIVMPLGATKLRERRKL